MATTMKEAMRTMSTANKGRQGSNRNPNRQRQPVNLGRSSQHPSGVRAMLSKVLKGPDKGMG